MHIQLARSPPHLCKESVPDYLNQVRSLCDKLATAGAPVTNVKLIVRLSLIFGPKYRDTPISYAELFEKLIDHELFLKCNALPKTAAVGQTSNSQTRTSAINNDRHSKNYQQQHSLLGHNRHVYSQEVDLVC